jgi:Zn ribbon nucleic-acid-binding protein
MIGLHPAWREYRRRLRALVASCAATAAIAWGVSAPGDEVAELVRRVLLSAALTACVAAVVWFAGFRCPYCGQHFHWTWWVSNPFARRCLHCGFEKWRDPHAARGLRR